MSTKFVLIIIIVFSFSVHANHSWMKYDVWNTGSNLLSYYDVNDCIQTTNGNMWFLYEGNYGITKRDGANYTHFTMEDGLLSNSISDMFEDAQGNVWITYNSLGVSMFDGVSWKSFTENDVLASNKVTDIQEDNDENIWFSYKITDDPYGITKFDGSNWTAYTTDNGLASNFVKNITIDSQNNLWLDYSTGSGITKFDGNNWITLTTLDGLVSNFVSRIFLNHDNDIWIKYSSESTLSMYNGETWINYTTADGLADRSIKSMFFDSNDNAWVLYYNDISDSFVWPGVGISKFDGTDWMTFTEENGLASNHLEDIYEDKQGNIWFNYYDYYNTSSGVTKYDGVNLTTYTTDDGLAGNVVCQIYVDDSGTCFFRHNKGITTYSNNNFKTYFTDISIRAIKPDTFSNTIWFPSNQGIYKYENMEFAAIYKNEGLGSHYVEFMIENTDGSLWFVHKNCVSKYDGIKWDSWLISSFIRQIVNDKDGNIWLRHEYGNGISMYNGHKWITYSKENGLASNDVKSFYFDNNGYLWVTYKNNFESNGVSKFDGLSWKNYSTADGLANGKVDQILEDQQGNIWFRYYYSGSGVTKFNGTTWTTYTTTDGLTDDTISLMHLDKTGNVWFVSGYHNQGVSVYNGNEFVNYNESNGLGRNIVENIVSDNEGNVWLNHDRDYGVTMFDGNKFNVFNTSSGLLSNNIKSLYEDKSGNIWFMYGAYSHFGITMFDGADLTTFTTADGLATNADVRVACEDQHGNIWVKYQTSYSSYGVSKFDGLDWTSFTTDNGLVSNKVRCILESSAGELWFGGRNEQGISKFGNYGGTPVQPDYIEVYGNVVEDSYWVADTIKVLGDVTIEDGVTLDIIRGSLVQFEGAYKFNVKGKLNAVGSAGDRIIFEKKEGGEDWRGITFEADPAKIDTSVLKFCVISDVDNPWNGGGIVVLEGNKVIISDCIIEECDSQGNGGGIYVSDADVSIINCLLNNNHATGNGGAIALENSDSYLLNTTISDNKSENNGGGLYIKDSKPQIYNSIIFYNEAEKIGNQVYVEGSEETPGFYFCDIEEGLAAFGLSDILDFTNYYLNNIDLDPQFNPDPVVDKSYKNYYTISKNSPCINKGSADTSGLNIPQNDLAGHNRIIQERIDIGSYECRNPNGIEDENIATDFTLYQNYPNPFNPTTTISYFVPENFSGVVNLKIYNCLGQLVTQLGKKIDKAGLVKMNFNASSLPSGLYYYGIKAGEKVLFKKMMLLK